MVCLLVQVLWTHGGSDEKTAAREQLFETVEKHPEHAASITLLGAIAALDGDQETSTAVRDDLLSLRTNANLHSHEQAQIESLLASLASLDLGDDQSDFTETQVATLLSPDRSHAWSQLAKLSGDSYAAGMALQTAKKSVPPLGDLKVSGLAKAFAGVGTVGDAQRAIAMAPWESFGRVAMADALEEHIYAM